MSVANLLVPAVHWDAARGYDAARPVIDARQKCRFAHDGRVARIDERAMCGRPALELARDERLGGQHRAGDRRQERLVPLALHQFTDVEIAVRRSRHPFIVL